MSENDNDTTENTLPDTIEEDLPAYPPRLYFSTGTHVYVLVYRWLNTKDEWGQDRDRANWRPEFLTPLTPLPFTGDVWSIVVDDVVDGQALIHVPPRYVATDWMGHPSHIDHAGANLPVTNVLVLRPSHTTPEIAALLREPEGHLWHIQALNRQRFQQGAPPPEPSPEVQRGAEGEVLFDIYTVAQHWGHHLPELARLSFEQALAMAESILASEGGIALRYHENNDTLEWLYPTFTSIPGYDIPGLGWE